MNKEKENCNFPYWKPVNQLPYPAVKGMLLVTNSDFDLPARPDLLIWKTIESVIGVADITLTINEAGTEYTLFKKVNNEVIEVGKIGAVSPENAEKLNKIDYVNYNLIVNSETHEVKFIGIDNNGKEHELSIVDYISYSEYNENKVSVEARLDTLETEADDLNNRIINLATDLTNLADEVTEVKNTINTVILPIINLLRTATNPGLVLSKASNGVDLEWLNKLSMEDVTAVIDNVNQTITFKKTINGITSDIITIDKITLQQIDAINNKLEPIDNTLNAYSNQDYVLAKIDNTNFDWHNPVDLVYKYLVAGDNITIEKINNKIVITSTGGGGGGDVTKAYVDQQDNLIKADLQAEVTRATTEETRLDTEKLDKNDFNDTLFNGLEAGDGITISRSTTRNDSRKVVITSTASGDVTKAYVDQQDNLIKTDLQAEVTRATTKENELTTAITNEVTRATTKENELVTSISNEATRATTKENELETELENKISYSNVVSMTYAEYQALETKDPNKFYMITDL